MLKKLMIVAHCDDETIFGGYDLLNKDIEWTIIIITNPSSGRKNKKRKNEFIKIANFINCKYEFWNYKNKKHSTDSWNIPKIIEKLNLLIKKNNYDSILTHNKSGEYGHLHHIKINEIIVNNFSNYKLEFFSKKRKNIQLQNNYINLLNFYQSKGGFTGLQHYWDSNKM